jgi:hypothetical protein
MFDSHGAHPNIRQAAATLGFLQLALVLMVLIQPGVTALPQSSPPVRASKPAGQQVGSAASIVLDFPADHSIGTLRFRGGKHQTRPAKAQGRIVLPGDQRVELVVNFQTASDLSPLLKIPPNGLFMLDLSKLEITNAQLKNIKHLTGLHTLSLRQTDISDAGLDYLQNMNNLSELKLGETLVTSQGLARLEALTALKTLYLDMTNVSDGGLESLARLKNLRGLSLAKTHVTDLGLKKLASLAQLDLLDIEYDPGVTDLGIKHLAGMKKLSQLQLANAGVTGKCIPYLRQLPALRELVYSKNNFTAQDLQEMHRAIPNCRLEDFNERRQAPVEMFAPLH